MRVRNNEKSDEFSHEPSKGSIRLPVRHGSIFVIIISWNGQMHPPLEVEGRMHIFDTSKGGCIYSIHKIPSPIFDRTES